LVITACLYFVYNGDRTNTFTSDASWIKDTERYPDGDTENKTPNGTPKRDTEKKPKGHTKREYQNLMQTLDSSCNPYRIVVRYSIVARLGL